jgi:predicted ABC-type ATPase
VSAPTLHILAGPNGAGKSTFVRTALEPLTQLPFINADEIAKERWPGAEEEHAYDASEAAAQGRDEAIAERRSFITETVFSHPSKVGLIEQALDAGYVVELHVILVSEDVTVGRVAHRVALGGHTVPEDKIRQRYRRLWSLVAAAVPLVELVTFYDNMDDRAAFRVVAEYEQGRLVGVPDWPAWAPAELTALGA